MNFYTYMGTSFGLNAQHQGQQILSVLDRQMIVLSRHEIHDFRFCVSDTEFDTNASDKNIGCGTALENIGSGTALARSVSWTEQLSFHTINLDQPQCGY